MLGPQVKAAVGGDPTGLERPRGDYWITHPDAVRDFLRREELPGVTWEPACGSGELAEVIKERPEVKGVFASDLYSYGYPGAVLYDFLTCPPPVGLHHLVTNPPFTLAEEFIRHALSLKLPGKVAIFARLALLEGRHRGRTLWREHPPARVWVYPYRVPLARNGGEFQTGLIAFAWFVWDGETGPGETRLGWLG